MKNRFKLLFIALFIVQLASAQEAVFELYLSHHQGNNTIEVVAKSPIATNYLRIDSADFIIQQFSLVNGILEKRPLFKQKQYKKAIEVLSTVFIAPFYQQIAQCDLINIVIDTSLISFPIEYLTIKGIPISLLKPIIFTLKGTQNQYKNEPLKDLKSGTIISDRTADPQKACQTVSGYYPAISYYSIEEINADQIKKQPLDLLLISAHGYTDKITNRGILGWRHKHLEQNTLAILNPKMTYFDACQQGVNLNYITALCDNNTLNYFLAPIVSNDSGDSSTKTMVSFFAKIKKGLTPALSLFETKKQLFLIYKNRRAIVQESKALCFRLYLI